MRSRRPFLNLPIFRNAKHNDSLLSSVLKFGSSTFQHVFSVITFSKTFFKPKHVTREFSLENNACVGPYHIKSRAHAIVDKNRVTRAQGAITRALPDLHASHVGWWHHTLISTRVTHVVLRRTTNTFIRRHTLHSDE